MTLDEQPPRSMYEWRRKARLMEERALDRRERERARMLPSLAELGAAVLLALVFALVLAAVAILSGG